MATSQNASKETSACSVMGTFFINKGQHSFSTLRLFSSVCTVMS